MLEVIQTGLVLKSFESKITSSLGMEDIHENKYQYNTNASLNADLEFYKALNLNLNFTLNNVDTNEYKVKAKYSFNDRVSAALIFKKDILEQKKELDMDYHSVLKYKTSQGLELSYLFYKSETSNISLTGSLFNSVSYKKETDSTSNTDKVKSKQKINSSLGLKYGFKNPTLEASTNNKVSFNSNNDIEFKSENSLKFNVSDNLSLNTELKGKANLKKALSTSEYELSTEIGAGISYMGLSTSVGSELSMENKNNEDNNTLELSNDIQVGLTIGYENEFTLNSGKNITLSLENAAKFKGLLKDKTQGEFEFSLGFKI